MVDNNENIFAEERKRMIVDEVNKQYKVTVAQLCDLFTVSPATIRNDLRDLEELELLKRTHGGAIRNNVKANFELYPVVKEVSHSKEKREIAEATFQFVKEGDTIILDMGTTMFEFSKLLRNIPNLTVVTNNLRIASYLESESSATVIVVGGMLRRGFHCTSGARTLTALNGLHVDKTFIAANGVNANYGLATPNIEIAKLKEKYVNMADEVYLLVDSSKIGKTSFVSFANLKDIDVMITDSSISESTLEEIRSLNLEVIVAENSGT